MTGSEFYAYVLNKFKRTDKEDEFYEACTDTIGYMRLFFESNDYTDEEYITGISSLGEYQLDLPSDFGHIIGDIGLVDTTTNEEFRPLKKISKAEFNRLYPDRLLSGTEQNRSLPQHYCIFGDKVEVGPVPDKTTYQYRLTYTTESFTEVTSATDPVPFTDKNYRNVLRSGVLMELHDGMENYDESQYWMSKFTDGLNKIKNNDYDNTRSNSGAVYHGF